MDLIVAGKQVVESVSSSSCGVASTAFAFLVGSLSVVVYFKKFAYIEKIENPPVQVLTVFVTSHGEKFHISKECKGLCLATTTAPKTQCLKCCPEGLIIL